MRHLLIVIMVVVSALVSRGTDRALLVGVGNYPAGSGWKRLCSINDVELLKPALQQRGFVVTTLTDAQATHRGIVGALQRLTRQCQAGDTVLVHFSCHGQQVEDLNSDEPDGLDEAIIPYDAQRRYSKRYHGQHHLLDDELNTHLVAMRKRLGAKGMLLLTVDACHSGDAYRDSGDEVVSDTLVGIRRGVGDVFCKKPPYVRRGRSCGLHFEAKTRGQGYSRVVAVCACQPDQCNYETVVTTRRGRKSYGTLSYMLWHGLRRDGRLDLRELGHWLVTYKSLYMTRYQQPHLFEE